MRTRWALLAALLLLGATFPSDDAGRPAPWCSYIDDSVTPNVSFPCSVTHPLPSGPAGASIATDTFGYGRAYFFGQTSTTGAGGAAPAITIFTDAVNVVGLHTAGAGSLVALTSSDGGRTWASMGSTGFPGAGGANNPQTLIRTVSPTPRFVMGVTGNAGSVATSTNIGGGWAFSTGLPLNNAFYSVASQGSAVLAVGPNAANNATVACISSNDGQTFTSCVTVDSAAASRPQGGSNPIVATPGINIWLTLLANGKIWRSADNGATWTNVSTPGGQGPIFCLSSTQCVAVSGSNVFVSSNAGVTWAQTVTLPTSGAAFTICPYNATVFDVLVLSGWPTTPTATTVPAFRSTDGGISFLGSPVTGATTALSNPVALSGPCSTTAGGRTSFVVSSVSNLFTYYGTVFQNSVQIVGSNGVPLSVDATGNFTGNQGLPQATSPNAWGVVPVQGPSLKNSKQTSAVTTANTITIAAVASQRVHLRRIDASCDTAAATAATLTVTDGATQVWALAATETVIAATRTTVQWQPSLDSTTGAAMTITVGACTAGTSLLQVQADQF